MILVIDNYDSFTYNLVQYLGERGAEVVVRRNDAVSVDDIRRLRPSGVLISPGPGRPEEAGISLEVIAKLGTETPIFGVCLGHQSIGQVFGGQVIRAPRLMHGKTSLIRHYRKGIFKNIPSPFEATRYHSLIVERGVLPKELTVMAYTKDKEIMALRHRRFPVFGVQFHPESIVTAYGKKLLLNFAKIRK